VATTLDQVYALLQGVQAQLATVAATAAANGSKLDILIPEMRLVMALQDDLAAATVTLQDETASLQDSNAKLAQVLADLQAAVAANAPVDPAVVTAFEAALGQHQTSVDAIANLVPPDQTTPPAGP
jgi:hypothetical protein